MLINLSNHPVKYWPENQVKSANQQFGEIVDLPFPKINPEGTSDEIRILARHYFELVLKKMDESNNRENAVHVMGELTFTFYLVRLLQTKGIKCVASTTLRKHQDNDTVQSFKFVQFREYL